MVAFLGALVLALVRNPIYGLYAYIAEFYLHPPSRWWGHFPSGPALVDARRRRHADRDYVACTSGPAPRSAGTRRRRENSGSYLRSGSGSEACGLSIRLSIGRRRFARQVPPRLPHGVQADRHAGKSYRVPAASRRRAASTSAFSRTERMLPTRLDGVGGPGIDDSNTLSMHLDTGVVAAAMLTLYLRDWRRYFCIVAIAFSMNAIVLMGAAAHSSRSIAGGLMLLYLRPVAYRGMFYVVCRAWGPSVRSRRFDAILGSHEHRGGRRDGR